MTTIEYRGRSSKLVKELEDDMEKLYPHFNIITNENNNLVVKRSPPYDINIESTQYRINVTRCLDEDGKPVLKDDVEEAYISSVANNYIEIKIDDTKYRIQTSLEDQ